MVQRPCCSPVFETTTCCVSNKTCLCFSCWRQTPLLFCQSRRAACLCKLSSRVSSRWQDAVVWTRAGAWKWRQEEKTSTETCREEEGERTATEILSSSLFFFPCFPTDTRLCSSKPCAGNATCIETGQGGYMCICPRGYMGENCQLKPGLCFSNR